MKSLLLPLMLLLCSCGSLQKWGLRSATPLFQSTSDLSTHEHNWNYFRDSTPGNLKFSELLYLQDPENSELLSLLVKGHAGYSFAVPETMLLEDEILGVEDSIWKREAISHYTRSLDYGLEYLGRQDISRKDLLELEEKKLKEKLDDKLNEEDLMALLYTAQSWGSLINLQKDNIALISQVPRVKILFDHVCEIHPEIDHGVCLIFNAQYAASRPRMLGGDPARAKELYQAAFKEYPQHLLIRVNYIQSMLLPSMESEAYEAEANILREEFAKWENLNRDTLENESEYRGVRELNLYNAIAKKRFDIIEKNKKKIF